MNPLDPDIARDLEAFLQVHRRTLRVAFIKLTILGVLGIGAAVIVTVAALVFGSPTEG